MLNPAFSKNEIDFDDLNYILPSNLIKDSIENNYTFNTGEEFRLQKVYGYEIWKKLYSLGLTNFKWSDKKILDVCCGTGFLSYHLLQKIRPQEITLLDISPYELDEARKLISHFNDVNARYIAADIIDSKLPDASFDLVIGNSFLHHFYNLPLALAEFNRILKPGGLLITLHEPTIAAVALESGSCFQLRQYLVKGSRYIDDLRYNGNGIAPGRGTDVWIFKREEMTRLLYSAGFDDVLVNNWHLLRPFIVAKMGLYLNEQRNRLSIIEEYLLRTSIFADSLLNKFIPSSTFGSFCCSAQKFGGCKK